MPRLPDRTKPAPPPIPASESEQRPPITPEQVLALARRYYGGSGRAIVVSIHRIPNEGYRTPESGQTIFRSTWRGYVLDANASNAVLFVGAGGMSEPGARFQLFIDLANLIREREESS